MNESKWWPRLSLARVFFWLAVIPVAVALDWVSSVAFVAACSLYANAASDFAAYRADIEPRLDRIERAVNDILERVR